MPVRRKDTRQTRKSLLNLDLKPSVTIREKTTQIKHELRTDPRQSKAFYLNTDNGPRLVLSNEYAREIHNSPYLSLPKAIAAELHCYIPGMEGYRHNYFPDHFGVGSMRLNIRRALSMLAIDLKSTDC